MFSEIGTRAFVSAAYPQAFRSRGREGEKIRRAVEENERTEAAVTITKAILSGKGAFESLFIIFSFKWLKGK